MIDFDFVDLDLDISELDMSEFDAEFDDEPIINKLDVKGVALEAVKKERVYFNLNRSTKQLRVLLADFDKKKVYKMLSVKGGFASINFIDFVQEREVIKELSIFSLAVGAKHMQLIDFWCKQGRIEKANFVVSNFFKNRGALVDSYGYYDIFSEICKKNGWAVILANNHAKIILMRTNKDYYVVESSSNLNENPKIEQFSFEADKGLYGFYYGFLAELRKLNVT